MASCDAMLVLAPSELCSSPGAPQMEWACAGFAFFLLQISLPLLRARYPPKSGREQGAASCACGQETSQAQAGAATTLELTTSPLGVPQTHLSSGNNCPGPAHVLGPL